MSFMKYRIGEMAKDFGVPTKVITNLVTEFFENQFVIKAFCDVF